MKHFLFCPSDTNKHTQRAVSPTTSSVFPASFMLKHKPSFVVTAQLLATFTQRAQCRCRRCAHGAVILRSSLQDWEEACGWAHAKHVCVPKLDFPAPEKEQQNGRVFSMDHLPVLFCICLLLLRYVVQSHVFFQSLQRSTVLRTMWINFLAQETGYRFYRIKLSWPEGG